MTQYHFVAASERFLTEEEPLEEVLRERRRNYAENSKEIDFWLVRQPGKRLVLSRGARGRSKRARAAPRARRRNGR